MSQPTNDAKFDAYARDYADLISQNVRLTGESSDYFAEHKLQCLERLGIAADTAVLDYGCGIGGLTAKLVARFRSVHGFDPSQESLALARTHAPAATFSSNLDTVPEAEFGLAIVANVLHHIPPAERPGVIRTIRSKLAPTGRLVVFEHNPWNPLTQRAVAVCPFDDDAVLLWPREVKKLLRDCEFDGIRQDYILFFPRFLAALRPLEPKLGWLMLGAQTMTVATRT
jgi:SAM-dependent methyltransferase